MLCSMTTTEFPASTRRCKTCKSRSISAKCRPVVGSSRIYIVRPVAGRASSRARLTQADIAQTDRVERLELLEDGRHFREKAHRLFHRHIQYLGDILALVTNL